MFFQSFRKTLLWAIVILILCLLPGKETNRFPWMEEIHADKIVHFIFYFVLLWLLAQGFKRYLVDIVSSWKILFYSFLICFFYGLLIETLQSLLIPHREGDILDMVANVVGSFMSLMIYKLRHRKTSGTSD